jgi:hypothetical protein
VGIGRTGWPYISLLRELGCRDLIGIDPRFAREHRRRGILFTNRLEAIQKGDIVVFLAGGGYEINVRQLPKIIAVNDMYPRFSDDQIASMNNTGTVVYEVALRAKGVESNIPIGDFDLDEIPGCLAQALVHATGLDTASMSQQEFDQNAAQLGILSRY